MGLTKCLLAMGAFSNIKGLSYYGDSKDDPYVTLDAVSSFSSIDCCLEFANI